MSHEPIHETPDMPSQQPSQQPAPEPSPSPAPSVISIDSNASIVSQVPQSAGIHPPMAPASSQPPQYARAAIRQQAAAVQAGIDREFLEQEARQWLNQCYICTVAGRDGDHELYRCRHPDSQAAKQWMLQVRSEVHYVRFQCCYVCGMPQSVCLGWQAGQPCPWRGALIPMIAGMLHGPQGGAVQDAWQRHLAGRMVEKRVVSAQKARREISAHPVNVHDIASVAAFLGQATPDGQGVEIQAAFCWLQRVCQASEPQSCM
jgi:hypothetical protein